VSPDWTSRGPQIAYRRAHSLHEVPDRHVSRRALAFLVFALAISAGCVRLGIWQLNRLGERRDRNAMLESRLGAPTTPVRDIARDTATAAFRRVSAAGTYDFANEFALASRTRQGSPGVNIITPLRLPGTDTAVLVNRGWVYAPDAMTVDFATWREADSANVTGFVTTVEPTGPNAASAATNTRVLRHLYRDSLAARLPYPVLPFLVVATDSVPTATAGDSVPARILAPMLDEGPHLGYAIQWFAFALIGIVGAAVGIRAERRGFWSRRATTVAPRMRR
jgi:surfeit locus 1 family protein